MGRVGSDSQGKTSGRLQAGHPSPQVRLNTESASVSSILSGPPLEIRPQTIREEATVYAVFAIE
jgi:hypothetical protein